MWLAAVALALALDAPPNAPSTSAEAPAAPAPPASTTAAPAPPQASSAAMSSSAAASPAPGPTASPAAASPAPAKTLDDDAAFVDGMRYYTSFEFEKASFRFRAATRNAALSSADLARAHVWLGLAFAQAGDDVAARDAFLAAARASQAAALPDDAPPKLRPLFDEARALHDREQRAQRAADARANAGPDAAELGGGPGTLTIAGAAAAGVGVVVVAAGAVAGLVALADIDAAAHRPDGGEKERADAASLTLVADVLLGAGVVTTAAGVGALIAAPFIE